MNKNIVAIFIISTVVAVSGCTEALNQAMDTANSNQESSTGSHGESTPDSTKGLEIVEFRVLNNEIQSREDPVGTTIEMVIQNYHDEPITVEEAEIIDTSLLTVENRDCTPSDIEGEELETAQEDYTPEFFCEWDVYPPEPSRMGEFDERTFNPRLYLEYESILENQDPFVIDFKDRDDIREMTSLEQSYTNNEISMTKTLEQNPVPTSEDGSSTNTMNIEIKDDGPGALGEMDSGEDFEIEFTPQSIYQNERCSDGEHQTTINIGNSVEFSCDVGFDQEVQRNVFTSVRYKYIKEPSVGITVVN